MRRASLSRAVTTAAGSSPDAVCSTPGGEPTISSSSALSPWCVRASPYTFATATASRILPPPDAPDTRMPASSGASTSFDHSSALKSAFVVISPPRSPLRRVRLALPHGLLPRTARPHLAATGAVPAVALRRRPQRRVRQLGDSAARFLHPALDDAQLCRLLGLGLRPSRDRRRVVLRGLRVPARPGLLVQREPRPGRLLIGLTDHI